MSKDDTIAILNSLVKLRIAPSKIHGVGIFAIRDIAKGQKLYSNILPQAYQIPYSSMGKLFPYVKDILLERNPNIINGSGFMYPDTNMQAYMNHGYGDEVNYDTVNDIVLKDIPDGTEVLEDYTKIPNYDKVFIWLAKQNNKDEKE